MRPNVGPTAEQLEQMTDQEVIAWASACKRERDRRYQLWLAVNG